MKYKSKSKARHCLFGTILALIGASANATTWDFEGVVDFCNPTACSLAGVAVGEAIGGYLSIDNAQPDSSYTEADVVTYGVLVQGITVGPGDSTIASATLNTDADSELVSGIALFAGTIDGGPLGMINLDLTIDLNANEWMIETDFLGLGVIASGPGNWFAEADDDDVPGILDNCTATDNAGQRDTDGDGIGNFCDPDFDQTCTVDFLDVGIIKQNFLLVGDLDTDLDGDGETSFPDLGIVKQYFLAEPGPSGLPNKCSLGVGGR